MTKYVIIGTGPAGTWAAETIRINDKDGEIIIISDEGLEFYYREHLNRFIAGTKSEEEMFDKGRNFSESINAQFINGRVVDINPEINTLKLANDQIISYDKLLLAAGGKPFQLKLPGSDLNGIHTLYSLSDGIEVIKSLKNAKNIVLIGGGSIALKIIPVLIEQGKNITIIERSSRIMTRVLDENTSQMLKTVIIDKGANVLINKGVIGFLGNNDTINKVILNDQSEISCDLAVVSIGIKPCTDILQNSKILYEKGVFINKFMQTNFPNIFAAGDIAQTPDPLYNFTPLLHPGWAEAKSQGICAGLNMTSHGTPYIGEIRLNRMSIYDFSYVSGGIIEYNENFSQIIKKDSKEMNYMKFIFKNKKLVGVLIFGRNFNSKKWKKWLKTQLLEPSESKVTPDNILDNDFLIK